VALRDASGATHLTPTLSPRQRAERELIDNLPGVLDLIRDELNARRRFSLSAAGRGAWGLCR
jgi:hypothetical protein